MKFEQYGEKIENLTIKIHPQEFIEHNLLKDLENLIGFIQKTKPKILKKFLKIFSQKIKNHVKNNAIDNKSKFSEMIKPFENLTKYKEIIILGLRFFLEKLSITEKEFWQNEITNFASEKFHNSANGFYFYQLTTFIELLGKEEAIGFYQDLLRNFILTYDLNQKDIYNSLDEMRERHIRFIKKNIFGRVRLFSGVENGKLIMICKNCEKVEHLEEEIRKEPDLLYYLTCWCHIPLAELWNNNFELTIEDCIAKGDPFCTYVYHDKRMINNLKQATKSKPNKIIEESS
jgi:hypothetical protein